ncbi:stAR-related lipid transfer protein 9 [Suncus etruscus]|uniref:stAR-related lipid transfer protein 9 n=1 Tax=Suncus etruscus TaxID=109475 RepID=UPI00210F6B96|nr:stAR-related lipid transfer protein 9 [Suncus etruscus]
MSGITSNPTTSVPPPSTPIAAHTTPRFFQLPVSQAHLKSRENKEGGRIIVEVDGKMAKIRNLKVDSRPDSFGDSREKIMAFGFDYCYWSVNPEDPHYASQDVVFQDLGTEVLSGAASGYNICLFAYGQTGSGKTYTMLGTPASVGLTPRICEGLFSTEEDCPPQRSSCRIKVSFLEIYNERVRDLLKQSDPKKSYTLRVREHPEKGPYVQGLSQHVVTNYKQVIQLLEEGIANRMTAATHVHEASSRSHAIFTIHYTQATMENNLPSEIVSKINLVDLAGSERADPSYCKDRITEGANINKSLVTLGIVISTLAQNSQVPSGCQSLSNTASDGIDSGMCSQGGPCRRRSYIPYRDSVLTWLLKDSLGGNSQTIMVATVSPAHTCYCETMSTLRYAANAKNIINKPQVNEDANIKLIRELREEIGRLKTMLLSFELRNFSSLDGGKDESLKELVLQNELKIDQLTRDWSQKWGEWKALMEHYRVDINRRRAGVVIDSSLPHLMALEDDVLSTGVVLYHLKEGITKIGRIDSEQEQDIVLQGQWIEKDHCTITSACGVVILRPVQGARCTVNGREITASCRLTQGAIITLGKTQKFRFNHPAEAAVLRQRRQVGESVDGGGCLEWLDLDGDVTAPRFGLCPLPCKEKSLCGRRVLQEQNEEDHQLPRTGKPGPKAQPQQQKSSVGTLRPQVVAGQCQCYLACLCRSAGDDQQCLLRGELRSASLSTQTQDHVAQKETEVSVLSDAWPETEPEAQSPPLVPYWKRAVHGHYLRRLSVRAAGRISQWKHLKRIFKKQRLLATQKRLEQLQTLCWPRDDQTWAPLCQVSGPDIMVQGPQQSSSSSTSHGSLSLRTLCIQYLRQLSSVFLKLDSSTTSPSISEPPHQISEIPSSEDPHAVYYSPRSRLFSKNVLRCSGEGQLCTVRMALARKRSPAPDACLAVSSDFSSIWEMEQRVGRQPCHRVSQSSASSCWSTRQLSSRDELETLSPFSQTLLDLGHVPAGQLGIHKAAKGAGGHPAHPLTPKQAANHGKATNIFCKHSKPPFPSTVSKREKTDLAARVSDMTKKSSYLPCGTLLKKQHNEEESDSKTFLTVSSPAMGPRGEKDSDLSDPDSSYSVDSLSYVCDEDPVVPLRSKGPQKEQDLLEPENNESDSSQISEDSLAEKKDQSPQDSPRGNDISSFLRKPGTRTRAFVRAFVPPSHCGKVTPAPRSFSLDSLLGAEEELGEELQEDSSFGPSDEMPTETFWHPQTSSLPCGHPVIQEAMPRLGSHQMEVTLDAILSKNHSFHLEPQPGSEPPASEVGVRSWEQAGTPQVMSPPRSSPLLSPDSWFSCDSKINSSSSPEIVGSLCPSPEISEFQPHSGERLEHRRKMEEPTVPGSEVGFPYTSSMSQDGSELPCSVRAAYTIPSCVLMGLSFCRTHSLRKSDADGTCQVRGVPGMAQQGDCKAVNQSGELGMLMPAASPLPYSQRTHRRNWTSLQQKYFLEMSHPVLGSGGGPGPTFSSLEEDNSSVTQASCQRESLLCIHPGVSGSPDFYKSPTHCSKIQHLRMEEEGDNLSVEFEGTSGFFTTSNEGVTCQATHPAARGSSPGRVKAWVVAAENEGAKCGAKAQGDQGEEHSQGFRKSEPITSSDYSFPKNSGRCNVTAVTKAGHWVRGWAPLSSAGQPEQGSWSSHTELPKADPQGRADIHTSLALSHPESCVHSISWDPFLSSLQPPPLETFYMTRSRDALTETALEIPAFREMLAPTPPARGACSFGHHQALHSPCIKAHLPVLFDRQNPKRPSSQQVQEHTELKVKDVSGKVGNGPGNTTEDDDCDFISSLVALNTHSSPSTNPKESEFQSQVGALSTHCLPEFQVKELATEQSKMCKMSPNNHRLKKNLSYCTAQTSGEEEQSLGSAPQQTQPWNADTHFPSPISSGFIYKTFDLYLDKDPQEESRTSPKSRPVHRRISSPKIMAWEENPASGGEGKHKVKLLGKTQHPRAEGVLRGAESTPRRVQPITCSQDSKETSVTENLHDSKACGKSPEMINLKTTTSEKKQRVHDSEEMARLIRSIIQLENDILEMECKQGQLFSTLQTQEAGQECVLLDQRRQEVADLVQMLDSSRSHLSLKVPPSPSKQSSDVIFKECEVREVGLSSCFEHEPRDQKTTLNPTSSRSCGLSNIHEREHLEPTVPDRLSRDTVITFRDYLGTGATFRGSSSTSATAQRAEALARAQPSQLLTQWSEKDGEQANALARGQPSGNGRLEEPEPIRGVEDSEGTRCVGSSKQEEPKGQVAMDTQRGRRLRKGRKLVSPISNRPPWGLHHKGAPFSQATSSLPSLPDSSTASPRELSSTSPSVSPRRLRSYLHASDTFSSRSSDEYVLAPIALRGPNCPAMTGAEPQGHSGHSGGTGLPTHIGGDSSRLHFAAARAVTASSQGAQSIPIVAEDTAQEAEGKMSVSTSLPDPGGGLRSPSMGLQRKVDPSHPVQGDPNCSQLAQRASCPREDRNYRGREVRQIAEEAMDLGPGDAGLALLATPKFPDLEPSAHCTPTDLATLEESQHVKAQKTLQCNVALPHCDTLLESEYSLGILSRPLSQQADLSARTRNEGGVQGFHMAPLSTNPGPKSAEERHALLTTPLSADRLPPLPTPEIHTQPGLLSHASSYTTPALNRSCWMGAGEQFTGHLHSSEIREKKEATETSRFAISLGSDSFPSSAAFAKDGRVMLEEQVMASPTWAPSASPGMVLQVGSPSTIGGESCTRHQDMRVPDTTHAGSDDGMATQAGQSTILEKQLVICDPHLPRLTGSNLDGAPSLEASTNTEGGQAGPRAVRGDLDVSSLPKWPVESVYSLPVEVCGAKSGLLRPTLMADGGTGLDAQGVGEKAPCSCPEQPFTGGAKVSTTLCCAGGLEGDTTAPCQYPGIPQPTASQACSSLSLRYRGDPEKRTFKAALCAHQLCTVSPGSVAVAENGRHRPGKTEDCRILGSPPAVAVQLQDPSCSLPSASTARKTISLDHSVSVGKSRLVGVLEVSQAPPFFSAKKRSCEELKASPLLTNTTPETLRGFQVNFSAYQKAQVSQTTPDPSEALGRPHVLSSSEGAMESEQAAECSEKMPRGLPEQTHLTIRSRGDSVMALQAKLAAKLKKPSSPEADSPWEEEEQQREQAAGCSDWGMCTPASLEGREKATTPELQMFSSHTRDSAAGARGLNGEPQAFAQHRCSLPVIAIFPGPKHSRASFQPHFSVISSSRSLQKLNLNVEPPSHTDEKSQDPSKLWSSKPSGKAVASKFPTGRSSNQEATCEAPVGQWLVSAASPPSPASSLLSCMPTPELPMGYMAGAPEEAQQAQPESQGSQARPEEGCSRTCRELLYFGSRDLNPCKLHWHAGEPAHICWKQSVFRSDVDVSKSQILQGAIPRNTDRSVSMHEGLAGRDSLLCAHCSSYARGHSDTYNSVENSRHSQESWEGRGSSLDLENPHVLPCSDEAAPVKGADKEVQVLSAPEGSSCREDSATGPEKEKVLLCPPQVGRAMRRTLEQGTQTGCTEISAQAKGSTVPVTDVSWNSMHSLSLHLSQLLHSTSELIECLSQPGVAEKEPSTKRESPEEVPLVLRMDGFTQTTVDEATQTELAQPPQHLPTPEADPEVSVFLEVLDSENLAPFQESGHISETRQKGESEKTAWTKAKPPDLNEHPHCRPQSPPQTSFYLKFQKVLFEQNFLSESPEASAASLTPSSQTEKLLCQSVSNLSLGPCPHDTHDTEDPSGALLVDRASSPILTLSANMQGTSLSPGALSSLLAHSLEDLQSLGPSLDLPQNGPLKSEEVGGCPRILCEGTGLLERNSLESPQHSPKLQVHLEDKFPQQLSLQTSLQLQSHSPPQTSLQMQSHELPPPQTQSLVLDKAIVPEDAAFPECDPLGPGQRHMEDEGEVSAPTVTVQPTTGLSSLGGGPPNPNSCFVSELTDTRGLTGSNLQPEAQLLLDPSSQLSWDPKTEGSSSLRDLPAHNKFNHWCKIKDSMLGVDVWGASCELHSGEHSGQRPQQHLDSHSRAPELSLRELIPLQIGTQNPSLSMELAEAKLHHGFGETDALLQVLQQGEALAAKEPPHPAEDQLYARLTLETDPQCKRTKQLPNFHWPHGLSLQREPDGDFTARKLDLPSRRREYLQQLRKDVVETTRSQGVAPRPTPPPSDIELLLQEYQQAREAAKQEIMQAQAHLKERTEQEKLRIRQQIISQLLREEEKLHLLATSGTLDTSSVSLSSGLNSGYNSSPALPGQLLSPDSTGDTNLPDHRDSWRDVQGWAVMGSSNRNLAGVSWKSVVNGHSTSLSSGCSPSSISSMRIHFPASYQDLAKHIVDLSMADVMAACSNSLHNLFGRHEAAGWKYQGQEQEVQLYHKAFSSTRHGFLGAGLVLQPLSHVWAAVSDPTLWPLYHRPIQKARLHQRVTNSINLVYLVCNTNTCALKQPRDFCCVCVEAKEGHLSIMAAQSVYEPSMPRPSRGMVRGEILPSAWILQPLTRNGKEITRVIYLAQVELGAPGFPPQLLGSFIKQQPLIIAKLASFLGS